MNDFAVKMRKNKTNMGWFLFFSPLKLSDWKLMKTYVVPWVDHSKLTCTEQIMVSVVHSPSQNHFQTFFWKKTTSKWWHLYIFQEFCKKKKGFLSVLRQICLTIRFLVILKKLELFVNWFMYTQKTTKDMCDPITFKLSFEKTFALLSCRPEIKSSPC